MNQEYTLIRFAIDIAQVIALGLMFVGLMVTGAWIVSAFMKGSRP
jgi:hypothetical protein